MGMTASLRPERVPPTSDRAAQVGILSIRNFTVRGEPGLEGAIAGIVSSLVVQVGLSIAILAGTVLLVIWGSARVYRIGILMYGKRPALAQISEAEQRLSFHIECTPLGKFEWDEEFRICKIISSALPFPPSGLTPNHCSIKSIGLMPQDQDFSCGRLPGGWPEFAAMVDVARLAAGAEMLGLMSTLFESTVEYLKTRQQFGRPLSSFQVLQHRLADADRHLEGNRRRSDGGHERP